MKTSFNTTLPYIDNDYISKLRFNLQNQSYIFDNELAKFQNLIQTNPILRRILNEGPCINWMLNTRTGKYSFVSENTKWVLGYPSQNFKEKGTNYLESLLHPEDSKKVSELMRRVEEFLLAQPSEKRGNYQFNCDYRILKANGSYIRLLQQSKILQTGPKGNISYIIGTYTDITDWKKNDVLTASIFSTEENTCLVYSSAQGNLQLHELISPREKEILKLVAKGYNSRQIAEQLCISHYTVTKHRRNIIQKTHRKNTSDLVQFAINHGII